MEVGGVDAAVLVYLEGAHDLLGQLVIRGVVGGAECHDMFDEGMVIRVVDVPAVAVVGAAGVRVRVDVVIVALDVPTSIPVGVRHPHVVRVRGQRVVFFFVSPPRDGVAAFTRRVAGAGPAYAYPEELAPAELVPHEPCAVGVDPRGPCLVSVEGHVGVPVVVPGVMG